ncbi:MAG: tyrosine-type recombinase/integrase [Roseburia sp.]|nr:tyrosine-type recombinase/integrase [Roseburia sp.]
MAKKRKGELPSGNLRKKVYLYDEPVFNSDGTPVIDAKTGRQKKIAKYESVTASSLSELNIKVAEVKLRKNQYKKSDFSHLTVYDAIDRYISFSDAILSPTTIRGYRTIQRNAFSSIMYTEFCDIDFETLQNAVNLECKRTKKTKKSPQPISSKTVINEYGLIAAVLHKYKCNVDTDKIKLPQIEHNQHELSSPNAIYEMVKGTNIELPVMLAMWLSFTASEIKGLTKSKSISSDGKRITIKEVIVTDENGKEVQKNKGKQPTRDRTLELPPYIKNLIDQVETDRLVEITTPTLSKRFSRLVAKSGLPHMTFHDLRHVNASVMAILQIPDKYAQDRGGWATDKIMKSTYQQTFSEERKNVDRKIDNYMESVISTDKSALRKEQKYKCWLELFDKKDTKKNKKEFETFCEINNITFS